MYNVLEKLKTGEALNAKEKVIHEHGLVAVLKTLHDELDRAVLDAYDWSDLAQLLEVVNGNAAPGAGGLPATREDCKRALDDALLERLVALNAERAAEENRTTCAIRKERSRGRGPPGQRVGRLVYYQRAELEAWRTARRNHEHLEHLEHLEHQERPLIGSAPQHPDAFPF